MSLALNEFSTLIEVQNRLTISSHTQIFKLNFPFEFVMIYFLCQSSYLIGIRNPGLQRSYLIEFLGPTVESSRNFRSIWSHLVNFYVVNTEAVDKANNYYSADRKLPWFVAVNWQLPVDFIQNDERPITQNEFKENFVLRAMCHSAAVYRVL